MDKRLIGLLMGVVPWGLLVWVNIPLGIIGLIVQIIGLILMFKS